MRQLIFVVFVSTGLWVIGLLLMVMSLACCVADLSLANVRFFIFIGGGGPLHGI